MIAAAPVRDEFTRLQAAWERRDRRAGLVSLMDHDVAYEPDYGAVVDARERLSRIMALAEGRELVLLVLARRRSKREHDRIRYLRRVLAWMSPNDCPKTSYRVGGVS